MLKAEGKREPCVHIESSTSTCDEYAVCASESFVDERFMQTGHESFLRQRRHCHCSFDGDATTRGESHGKSR
jgi:hypothetical protein